MHTLPHLSSNEIVALRPSVERPLPGKQPLDVLSEAEAYHKSGGTADVLTVLLRGSECTFRCLMCDLWKYTHPTRTAPGAITAQVQTALSALEPAKRNEQPQWIKLYNASNFFAPVNVPVADLRTTGPLLNSFDRVIVENHPKLLPGSIIDFRDCLAGKLEIAMGLESIHPETLLALNKQMHLGDFQHACEWLLARDIDVRTFILLRPPGMEESEGIEWCIRSVEYAHALGVRHISIIPVRAGNGAIEKLAEQGLFTPPQAASLEQALRAVIDLPGAIVTADLWNWRQLRDLNEAGGEGFRDRIARLNLEQCSSAIL